MTRLAELALSAILSIARPPAVDVDAERPRLKEMAEAIADAVAERDMLAHWLPGLVRPLPFDGPDAREASALALVSIAAGESAFAAEVADCRRVGADHPSITAWQLLGRWASGPYSREELCASPRLAAERALWVLAVHAERCGTPAKAFAGYASGDCGRDSHAAREHCRRWGRLADAHGVSASCTR